MMKVIEREACRASALDTSSPVALGVIAWMPFALRLNAFGNLELVTELKHSFSSKNVREPMG